MNLNFFKKGVQSGVAPKIHAFFFFTTQYSVSPGATVQRGYVIFPKSAESEFFMRTWFSKRCSFSFLLLVPPK